MMKYGELAAIAERALPELSGKALPVKAAMKVVVMNQQVSQVLAPYNEMRRTLIEKHARRDKQGRMLYWPNGDIKLEDAFWPEINEVLGMEAETIDISPIRLADLGDIMVTPAALMALGDLLVVEGLVENG